MPLSMGDKDHKFDRVFNGPIAVKFSATIQLLTALCWQLVFSLIGLDLTNCFYFVRGSYGPINTHYSYQS
jgi:hypothetical protein